MESKILKVSSTKANKNSLDIEKFRAKIRNYIDKHQYEAAEFWSDKLIMLSGASPVDVYFLTQCYYFTRQYHRAIHVINQHKLLKNPTFRYLAVRCQYETGNYHAALEILDQGSKCLSLSTKNESIIFIPEIDDPNIESSNYLLRGLIHEALDNRSVAAENFKDALKADPMCFEAFRALTKHQMLSCKEETELIASLPLKLVCNEKEETFVKAVYETKLNKYSTTNLSTNHSTILVAENNLDYLISEAEKLYYQSEFSQCYKLTQDILQRDPYHPDCLPIYISCLVELKLTNELFLLGHKLVEFYPDQAVAWFAVGCYYYLIGKNDHARRFLSKATSLDKVYGPAWIAYGHSFAAENEHDQARAAYYKAAQLMKGCHLPLLYIGMEYSLINNNKFAEKFFKEAIDIAPDDPFVHHELGIIAYANNDFVQAEKYFHKTLSAAKSNRSSVISKKWGTVLNNLGQTYWKLCKYDDALEMHHQALRASPGNATSYASIGVIEAQIGNYQAAIIALHKALSLQRDHSVASTLLTNLMNVVVSTSPAFEGGENYMMSFELINIDSPPCSAKTSTFSNDLEEVKKLLGTSIGQPVINSSGVLAELTDGNITLDGNSSALLSEDMIMDEESD